MTFFPKIPKWESQNLEIVSKLWMFIFFSNQTCVEHVMAIFYRPEKDIFNSVLYALIKDDLTLL